jgi:hypothetical protein
MLIHSLTQKLSSVILLASFRRVPCALAAVTPRLGIAAFALTVLSLAACSTPSPPKPAMVPIGANGNYGYAEVMLEPDRYQVSYLTPRLTVSNSRSDRDANIVAAKAKAHDLALWRAAQLGREKAFSSLKVVDEHTDTDVNTNVQRSYQPGFYGYGFYGYGGHRRYPGGFGPVPWFPGDYPYDYYGPGDYYERTTSSMRVNSRLEVKFFKTSADQAQSIETVIDDMAKKYSQATYP